jgi:maltose O-acetyltransferase
MIRGAAIFTKCKCNIGTLDIRSSLGGYFEVIRPERLVVGDYCMLNSPLFIHAGAGVYIGHHTHIAQNFTLYSVNHDWRSPDCLPYGPRDVCKPVVIGHAVWICANVTIAPGVVIGNGAILSIGSVVFSDVPECAVVRGNPAEVITYRNVREFRRLCEEGKFI